MVQVVAPPDWRPNRVAEDLPAAEESPPVSPPLATDPSLAKEEGDDRATSKKPFHNHPIGIPRPSDREAGKDFETGSKKQAKARVVPPPLPARSSEARFFQGAEVDIDFLPPAPPRMLPAGAVWAKWLLLGLAPVAGFVLAMGAWSLTRRSDPPPAAPSPVATSPKPSVESRPPTAKPTEKPTTPAPAALDRRWLPDDTRLLVQLRLSRVAGRPEFCEVDRSLKPIWQPGIGGLLQALRLRPESVRQLTWASTELTDWPNHAVIVIQLEAKQDATALCSMGEPTPGVFNGVPCRHSSSGWTHPFAVLDSQTIVTGREDLLQRLATRGEKKPKFPFIDRFLQTASPNSDLLVVADLAAARRAGWPLPTALADVWPAGRKPWHLICEAPLALGLTFRSGDQAKSELALICEGETTADQVQAAVAELVPAAKTALDHQLGPASERLQARGVAAEAAKPYRSLLERAKSALRAVHWQLVDEMVWIQIDWGADVANLAQILLASQPALRADWLQAAQAADEAQSRRLLSGLNDYRRAEGAFPAGAAGGALLPAETRLSWIATLLPYYGHQDWHRELQFGYSWNSPQNRNVTRRQLDPVINPALGPSTTEAGFPVTNYVGLAGVGADAAELKPDNPRAGVFGYNRMMRSEEIPDGASNTVALLGVRQRTGAWASGGEPTVRALTKRPYVNGPDGFGSGQPGGMLVGMADGAVRFVSKDVDPTVLEQLATAGGKESTTVAALEPKATERAIPKAASLAKKPDVAKREGQEEPLEPAKRPASPKPDEVAAKRAATVETEARLAEAIPEFVLPGVSFHAAVDLISQMSGLPITFDLDATTDLGVSLDDRVTVRLAKTTFGAALEQVASSRGMVYVVEDGQILVTTPPKRHSVLETVRYNVADLTGQDPVGAAELVELLEKLVMPDSWQAAGGRGTLQMDRGTLVVVQTALVQRQVLTFCEKLRLARGKPLSGQHEGGVMTLATRLAQARKKLDRAVTLNFPEPTPLARILAELEGQSQSRILVNWLALRAAGISPQTTATLKVAKQPLCQALETLLQPHGLAYRVAGADIVEITTIKANSSLLETEFYPVGPLLDRGATVPGLLERIQSAVAEASWSEAGGSGALYVDRSSRCLMVLQSQPVHALLGATLSRWEKEKK
jgi:hypothetical protein